MKFNVIFMLFAACCMSVLGASAQDGSTESNEYRYYLVDCSGSMTWTFDAKVPNNSTTFSKLETLKKQLIDECKGSSGAEGALRDGVHVELIQFVDDVYARSAFELKSEGDRDSLIKAIQNIQPRMRQDKNSPTGMGSSKTRVWHVLEEVYAEAFKIVEADETARVSIIVVSDGEDESGVPTDEALAFLTDPDVKDKLRGLRKQGRGIRPVLIALSWNVNDFVKTALEDVGGVIVEADNPKDVLFPVEAIVTIVPSEVEVGEPVYVTSLSDGSVDSTVIEVGAETFRQKQVSRVFDEPGNYDVVLTVYDRNGVPHVDKGVVVVKPSSLQARFTVSKKLVVLGDSVIFNNESTGAVERCEWVFSDGMTSDKKNPSIRFNKPGKYSAKLTVRDKNGRSDAVKIDDVVEVTPPPKPVAAFNGPDKVIVGDPNVTFVSAAENAKEFLWKLDGKIVGREEHLRYVFKTTDTSAKTLTLEVTSPYGDKASIDKKITVANRVLDFTALPEFPTVHEPFKLVVKNFAVENAELAWTLNGEPLDPESVTIDKPGEYEIVLKVVDPFGETVCKKIVGVLAPDKPVASFVIPDFADVDKPFKIMDNSQRSESRSYLLDGKPLDADSDSPTVVFNEPGEHTIEQICTNEGGETRLVKTIEVRPYDPPTARIKAVAEKVRAGKPAAFVVDVKGDARSATILWGDGKEEKIEFTEGPDEEKSWAGEHIFDDKGDFSIVCYAEGRGGKSADSTLEFPVAPRRLAPKAYFDYESKFKDGKWNIRIINKSVGDGPFTYKFSDGSDPVEYKDTRDHLCAFLPGDPISVTLVVSNGDEIEPVFDSIEKRIPLPTWMRQNALLLLIGAVFLLALIAAGVGLFVWYAQGGIKILFKYRLAGDPNYTLIDVKTWRREKDIVLTVRNTDAENVNPSAIPAEESPDEAASVEKTVDEDKNFEYPDDIDLRTSYYPGYEDDIFNSDKSDIFGESEENSVGFGKGSEPVGKGSEPVERAPRAVPKPEPKKKTVNERKMRVTKLSGKDPRYTFAWVDAHNRTRRIGSFKKREITENAPCESDGIEFCFIVRS